MRFVITLFVALLVLTGCKGKPGGAPVPRTTTITEQQATDLARAAVQERDTFAKTATYQAKAEGNGWVITVQADKEVRQILLDKDGKVVSYLGGHG